MDDVAAQIKDFLTTRRARVSPERAGLAAGVGQRRVKGLRREEVALLAGVSVDYYTRLERGRLGGASDEVLAALASALNLDEAETAYLYDLARAASRGARRRCRGDQNFEVRPAVQRLLDAATGAPMWVRNDRMDVLAANDLGRALYEPMLRLGRPRDGRGPANSARFAFLADEARDFFVDWRKSTNDCVAKLRAAAGRNPFDRRLSDLVGELSTQSEHFRTLWAKHEVVAHRTGRKSIRHPEVGELDLSYEVIRLEADPGLTILAYTAEPGTATAERLALLASLAATARQTMVERA